MSSTEPHRFTKSDRLVRSLDITRVLKTGECVADGVLVMFAVRQSAGSRTRLGVTISKRTGNAVVRNRWKRWIRESFRTQRERIPDGLDLVIRPKKDAVGEWEAIRRSVPALARRVVKRLGDAPAPEPESLSPEPESLAPDKPRATRKEA